MERLCGMLIPLINSRKLLYINLNNNVLLQERFKYLRFLPIFNKKVFSNFEEKKENTWPIIEYILMNYMIMNMNFIHHL